LYFPESRTSGFDATEIKGITTETPAVSTRDKKIDIKKRATK
jgi:hypothetical protein